MKVSLKEYLNFKLYFYNNNWENKERLGRAFCDWFNIIDNELFYSKRKDAISIIENKYLDYNGHK